MNFCLQSFNFCCTLNILDPTICYFHESLIIFSLSCIFAHLVSKINLAFDLFLSGLESNRISEWSDACLIMCCTSALSKCNIHSAEPKNLSNFSCMNLCPSQLFALVHTSPWNFMSLIFISEIKFLKSEKLLSCLLLPPFFSSWSFMSLKSPYIIHLSPHICLIPFSHSHFLCLSFASVLVCIKVAQKLSFSPSGATCISTQKSLLLIILICTCSLQATSISPFLPTRSLNTTYF